MTTLATSRKTEAVGWLPNWIPNSSLVSSVVMKEAEETRRLLPSFTPLTTSHTAAASLSTTLTSRSVSKLYPESTLWVRGRREGERRGKGGGREGEGRGKDLYIYVSYVPFA